MKHKPFVIAICLLVLGCSGSLFLSRALSDKAQLTWENEASQAAGWFSSIAVNWIEESYAQVLGLAALYENSQEVTEDEFHGVLDSLQNRLPISFIDALFALEPAKNGSTWVVQHTNSYTVNQLNQMRPNAHALILETLKNASGRQGEVTLGRAYVADDDSIIAPVALVIEVQGKEVGLLGFLNLSAVIDGLFEIHRPAGLGVSIEGVFDLKTGTYAKQQMIAKRIGSTTFQASNKNVLGGATISINWDFNHEFNDGPNDEVANVMLLLGMAISAGLAVLAFILLQRNELITYKVKEATVDLRDQQKRLDLTLTASGIGLWELDLIENTVTWDATQHAIFGTDPADGMTLERFMTLVHPDDREFLKEHVDKLVNHGVDLDVEYKIVTPSGEVRYISSRGQLTTDSEQHSVAVFGTNLDITDRKAAEESIRRSQQQVTSLLHALPIGVALIDPQGEVVEANTLSGEIVGLSADQDVVEQNQTDGIEVIDLDEVLTISEFALRLASTREETKSHVVGVHHSDGGMKWVNVSSAQVDYAASGGVAVAFEDITEQKKTNDELTKLSQAVDQSPGSMVITDLNGDIEYVNPTFTKVTGYSSKEAIGKSTSIMKSGQTPPEVYKDMWITIKAGRQWRGEILNRKKNGELFWESVSISPLTSPEGEIINYFAVKGDITDRKEMEEELQKRVQDLDETQSAMLNMMEDLDEEKEKAENATQAKSDFLANMSHEIRTPMNAVIGMSHLALQTDLDRKQRNYIEKVHRSAESLLGIINDILDFSKIEAGKMEMEQVDFRLEDVFDNLANLVGLKAEEKGLELMFDIPTDLPTALIGDSLRLGQILVNLGNNAVKFTETGEVVISAKTVEENSDEVKLHFTVRDSGVGMNEKQQGKLFQSFSQADTSTTRQYGGTGLGLAISKKLTDMLRGEIWVTSEPRVGSIFHFTAYFGKQQGEGSKRRSTATELGALRVLVVDDNNSAREILSSMLASFGLRVDQAGTGQTAIAQIIDANNYDPYQLVLMDWKMPGMDGIETIRSIQSKGDITEIPTVIMVTAYGREEAAEMATDIAISSFLTKPVTSSTLLDAIMVSMGHIAASDSRSSNRNESSSVDIAKLMGAEILLVEDNEINQELAMELLINNGIKVTVANDGQEALDILEKTDFDGVLMDCQMPVMDGYLATRKLRAQERYKILPILAMTANAMAGDKERVLAAGMNDHIAKPINVEDMFHTMAKWITPSNPLKSMRLDVGERLTIPNLAGINTVDGLARTQGNTKLYLKLLKKVRSTQKDFIINYTSAVNDSDWELAQRLAHTLKGISGNIGADQLQKMCAVLEAEAETQNTSSTSLVRADTELNKVMQSLDILSESTPQNGPTKEAPFDREKLKNVLTTLRNQIEEYDTGALETIEQNMSLFATEPFKEQRQLLEKSLEAYDFEASLKIADKIRSIVVGKDEPKVTEESLNK